LRNTKRLVSMCDIAAAIPASVASPEWKMPDAARDVLKKA
jgi:hypothetical protein